VEYATKVLIQGWNCSVSRSLVLTNELLQCKLIILLHHTDCGGQAAAKFRDFAFKKVQLLFTTTPLTEGRLNIGIETKRLFAKKRHLAETWSACDYMIRNSEGRLNIEIETNGLLQ
jgi:hypothetical protein